MKRNFLTAVMLHLRLRKSNLLSASTPWAKIDNLLILKRILLLNASSTTKALGRQESRKILKQMYWPRSTAWNTTGSTRSTLKRKMRKKLSSRSRRPSCKQTMQRTQTVKIHLMKLKKTK